MIVTLTLNPSLDRTLVLESLRVGEVLRAASARIDPGGKGVNVTRVLRPGSPVSVYGYPLEQRFEAAGYIELDPAHPEPPRTRWTR